MTDVSAKLLRQTFLLDYGDLKTRLARRLGSSELASEALQDVWLRLEDVKLAEPVQQPRPYIFRIAYNIALKRLRSQRNMVTLDDAEAAIGLIDDRPNAEHVATARSDLERLQRAVKELTPRRREILLASRLDGTPLHVLAERFAVPQRLIERELQRAVLHCAERLDRKVVQRFGPRKKDTSPLEPSETNE
ncbi:RNA polymerase sigma factor [Tardiphaga robiniae]|uniref:RNA polymerase sigma factor n=1 Tax=Tardiphaga robiniae TaxID=943830 RepID=A0A163ZSR5_9BRAD|nr:sigma-70 family RNA polymerase sigma factor [Tardiphaga robiniae]KZD23818.1 hypothetical protein A4A58_26120 [Tardiphaga robiniae]